MSVNFKDKTHAFKANSNVNEKKTIKVGNAKVTGPMVLISDCSSENVAHE